MSPPPAYCNWVIKVNSGHTLVVCLEVGRKWLSVCCILTMSIDRAERTSWQHKLYFLPRTGAFLDVLKNFFPFFKIFYASSVCWHRSEWCTLREWEEEELDSEILLPQSALQSKSCSVQKYAFLSWNIGKHSSGPHSFDLVCFWDFSL